jgi:hypothetical protein
LLREIGGLVRQSFDSVRPSIRLEEDRLGAIINVF